MHSFPGTVVPETVHALIMGVTSRHAPAAAIAGLERLAAAAASPAAGWCRRPHGGHSGARLDADCHCLDVASPGGGRHVLHGRVRAVRRRIRACHRHCAASTPRHRLNHRPGGRRVAASDSIRRAAVVFTDEHSITGQATSERSVKQGLERERRMPMYLQIFSDASGASINNVRCLRSCPMLYL